MNNSETYNAVKWALEAGYKHVDTAEWWASPSTFEPGAIVTDAAPRYENEGAVGKALNEYLGMLPSC